MYAAAFTTPCLGSGVALSGATVHYVDEEYDRGPIIAQWPVPVRQDDTADTLAARVLEVEHRLLPQVVEALARLGVPERPSRLSSRGSASSRETRLLSISTLRRTGGRVDRLTAKTGLVACALLSALPPVPPVRPGRPRAPRRPLRFHDRRHRSRAGDGGLAPRALPARLRESRGNVTPHWVRARPSDSAPVRSTRSGMSWATSCPTASCCCAV